MKRILLTIIAGVLALASHAQYFNNMETSTGLIKREIYYEPKVAMPFVGGFLMGASPESKIIKVVYGAKTNVIYVVGKIKFSEEDLSNITEALEKMYADYPKDKKNQVMSVYVAKNGFEMGYNSGKWFVAFDESSENIKETTATEIIGCFKNVLKQMMDIKAE